MRQHRCLVIMIMSWCVSVAFGLVLVNIMFIIFAPTSTMNGVISFITVNLVLLLLLNVNNYNEHFNDNKSKLKRSI